MSLSLTNRDDIIANSFSIITANGSVVDILDAIQGSIVGLPPESLNTIEKLSAAISNDPNYFQTMSTNINAKAPAATTYSKNQVDANIAAVVGAAPALLNTLVELSAALNNDHNYAGTLTTALAAKAPIATTYTKTDIDTALDNLQTKITKPYVANTVNLYDVSSIKPLKAGRGIVILQNADSSVSIDGPFNAEFAEYTPGSIKMLNETNKELKALMTGANITLSDVNNIVTIAAPNVYTKLAVDALITPKANTADVHTKLAVDAAIAPKANTADVYTKTQTDSTFAPKASPALTGTTTAENLTVNTGGNLGVGITNIITELGNKVNTSTLSSYATLASPTFTGTVGGLTKNTVQLGNVDNTTDL